MDNPARAVADAPPKAAKGVAGLLKNKPPAFYIVLVAGILAAAWYIRKREAASAPVDETASTITDDGSFNPTYGPTDGAIAGGYGGGGIDTTGGYAGGSSPIETANGFLYDPATGMVYGALPDSQMVTPDPTPVLAGTGGGMPTSGGAEVHAPVVTSQVPQPSSVSWTCPAEYPNHGPNPGSCYKTVCLKKGDGHGHGPGKWHVYRDGTWRQVTSGSC